MQFWLLAWMDYQIKFWICLLLSFFGYLPGIIYAVWVIVNH